MINYSTDESDIIKLEGQLFSDRTVIGQYLRYINELSNESSRIFEDKYKNIIKNKKNEKQVFLSIIIRTQGKRQDGLRESLLCIEAQTDKDFEVLIMGHKVEEKNKKIITSIIDELNEELKSKVKYIEVNTGGRSTPINYGFAYARGEYAAIFDDDDLLFDNWVAEFHDAAKIESGKLLHAYALSQEWKENNKDGDGYCAIGAPKPQFTQPFNMLQQLSANLCPLMSIAFPTYLFNDYGIIFNESLDVTEDWEYIMRVSPLCGVYDIEEVTSIYRLWNNLENSAKVHDQKFWDSIYSSIRERINSNHLLIPRGFLTPQENNNNSYQAEIGFPRMVSLLFCDVGDGFSDKHYVVANNLQTIPSFKVKFELPNDCQNSKRFRIDPCEFGGIILRNCTVTVLYADGTHGIIKPEKCQHNGVKDGEDIYFMHYDPQFMWTNSSSVTEIWFEGYISMEVPEKLIQRAIFEESWIYLIKGKMKRIHNRLFKSSKEMG